MSIIQWMIDEKLAKNGFAASYIANGLELAGLTEDEQRARVKLYRDWRASGIFGKNTKPCYSNILI